MGKNVSAPVKALILLGYMLLVFSFTAFDDGSSLSGFDLENPSVVIMLKLTQAISAIFLFILPALAFAHFTSEKRLGYLKLSALPLTLGVACVALVFSAMPVINWLGEMNGRMVLPEFLSGLENWMRTKEDNLKVVTEIFLEMDTLTDLSLNLFIIGVLAAVGEELLFRGGLQNSLEEWTKNKHIAIWITAILFSAFHAQFYGFVPRMLMGVVLGYLYVWSGSLWLPMLFHFLNNGLAVLFSYLIGKGAVPDETETIGAGDSPIIYVLGSAFISAGVLMYIYMNRKPSDEGTSSGEKADNH